MQSDELFERILMRLGEAEVCEPNHHFRDDYRIAWITVLHSGRGSSSNESSSNESSSPHVRATVAVLGRHPDDVWPWIVAWRKAKLGNEYSAWYDENGNLRPEVPTWSLAPKKPVQMELCFRPRRDQEGAA